MKTILKVIRNRTFVIAFSVLGFIACNHKDKCYEAVLFEGGGVTVDFFSVSANRYIYGANSFSSLFSKDSLDIRDQNGTGYRLGWGGGGYDPNNPLIPSYELVGWNHFMTGSEQETSYSNEISKNFYIRYTYNQFDTLNFRFKCRKNECSTEFEYLKIYYKGNLIREQNGDVYTRFTLKRP